MTAYPQHPYPTPSASPQPPNPRLSRKPTFVRQVRQAASPPASAKFITRPIPPCYYDRTNTSFIPPLDIPAALKAAENSKDGKGGSSRSKEKAKREKLGLKVYPPTPITRHYMRKALPPVPGATPKPHSRTETGRVEKSRRSDKASEGKRSVNFDTEPVRQAPRKPSVNQLRGYKIDTPHPMRMNLGRTADDYLAAKRRRRAERDRSEAMELAGFPYVVSGSR